MKVSETGGSFLSMPVVWRVPEMSMDKMYLVSHVLALEYRVIRNRCAKIHSCTFAFFQKLNSVITRLISVCMNILWPKSDFRPLYTKWIGVAAKPLACIWEVLSYNLRQDSGILTEISHRFPKVPLGKWRGSTMIKPGPRTSKSFPVHN